MNKAIDISPGIIFRAGAIFVALWFLYVVRDVIALFLVAIIVTAALNPLIIRMQRSGMPRTLAVAIVYICFFVGLGVLISFIIPNLSQQVEDFSGQFPTIVQDFAAPSILDNLSFENLGEKLSGSLGDVFSTTVGVFTGIISIVAVVSMSFYMSLQKDGLKRSLLLITPRQHEKYVASLIDRIQESFGRWMAGQLVTMIFVGTLYYFVLLALGVPYALILAILGGLLEIVPYFGPIIAVIPAAILGFLHDPIVGVTVLMAYGVINLIENHVLVPKIMNKAVGLNPVLVILALLMGAKIAGVVGIFLAVPLAAAIGVFVKDVLEKRIE